MSSNACARSAWNCRPKLSTARADGDDARPLQVILVDTNVIVDVWTADPRSGHWSAGSSARAAAADVLAVNPIIFAGAVDRFRHGEPARRGALQRRPAPPASCAIGGGGSRSSLLGATASAVGGARRDCRTSSSAPTPRRKASGFSRATRLWTSAWTFRGTDLDLSGLASSAAPLRRRTAWSAPSANLIAHSGNHVPCARRRGVSLRESAGAMKEE